MITMKYFASNRDNDTASHQLFRSQDLDRVSSIKNVLENLDCAITNSPMLVEQRQFKRRSQSPEFIQQFKAEMEKLLATDIHKKPTM